MEVKFNLLQTVGYLDIRYSEEQLNPIKQEINDIMKSNFSNGIIYTHRLVANIKKEYVLVNCHRYIEDLLYPHIMRYAYELGLDNELGKNIKPTLESVWVNFQKKHDFNPVHRHSNADISFVIWINIPYKVEDELGLYDAMQKCGSGFQFICPRSHGDLNIKTLLLSKEHENTGIIFPGWLHHTVYPFYTSDDYRISVAGNFKV
jgi:hypothetical protein